MEPTFTQEERDVVIKLVTDIKINVLDQNAIGLVSVLQSIAKKVFSLSQPIVEREQVSSVATKKATKKSESLKDSGPGSF